MARDLALWLAILALGAREASASPAVPSSTVARSRCPVCGEPVKAGKLANDEIREPSGVVQSAIHPGVFFVHNDSGNAPRIYAFGLGGDDLATFSIDGATNVDWEEIAGAPCGSEHCIYLGDIGEGKRTRTSYAILRLHEPKEIRSQHVAAEVLPFRYADGEHDAETLLVDPAGGALFVITKVKHGPSLIYELPLALGQTVVAKKVGELSPPEGDRRFTAGAIRPDRSAILLRTHSRVLFYRLEAGEPIVRALARPPCVLPVAAEAQGESIAWLAQGYLTLSEKRHAKIHRVDCTSF